MVSTFLLLRSAFKIFFKQEEAVIVDESKTEETIEEKEQETTIENTPEPEPVNDKEEDSQQVYRMLDFDRRYVLSIGEQDDYTCSIYCLAYARAILDNNVNVNPYDYWDDGSVEAMSVKSASRHTAPSSQ